MNFQIVLHLLKTDWQRLRWLILACWVLMLIAAWPALTFSAGEFRVPLDPGNMFSHGADNDLREALEARGELSPLRDWIFVTMSWLFTGTALFFSGCLGFHARMWTEGRPTRRRETIVAKTAGLLLFAVLPVVLVLTAIPLLQGYSWDQATTAGMNAAATLVPRLAGVMLFGVLCGGWWSWLAGMFAVAFAFLVLPRLLQVGGGLYWWGSPLKLSDVTFREVLPLWIGVAVLSLLLVFVPRHVAVMRKIATSIVAILIATHLLKFIPPPALPRSLDPLADLPDWSSEVKPVLLDQELAGSISEGVRYRGPNRNTSTSAGEPILDMLLSWKTEGLPKDAFATWMPEGSSRLVSEGREITSTRLPASLQWEMSYGGTFTPHQREALDATVNPGGKALKWDGPGDMASGYEISEPFAPIEPGRFSDAELEMELKGLAYRMVKIVDVPLGAPVQVQKNGITIHIRRLDIEGYMPFADVCMIMPMPSGALYSHPDLALGWIPVIHLQGKGIARMPWAPYWTTIQLAPGFVAVRKLYLTGQTDPRRLRKLDGYDTARFIFLKRENLATMRVKTHSASLPLMVAEDTSRGWYRTDPPPLDQRPDPATANAAAFEKWKRLSSMPYDRGWESRDLADFVPRHLDRILARTRSTNPPSVAEGNAIILACPENRKDEVIAALPRRNKIPDNNWLSDVILRRGWVQDAAPQIREMAAHGEIGKNAYSQLMLAMLEDPQTYPALLEQEPWFDIYVKIRQLPGIEPELTEAISARYRQWKAEGDEKNPRWRYHHHLLPAAHGIPEALADLLEDWRQMPAVDQRVVSEEIRKAILLPGDPRDVKTVIRELAARGPADFRYDPLARLWVPISSETP